MRPRVYIEPCRFCNRTFARNEHLARHERTHTNDRPFPCRCGKAFSRRDLLSRHIKSANDDQVHGEKSSGPQEILAGTKPPVGKRRRLDGSSPIPAPNYEVQNDARPRTPTGDLDGLPNSSDVRSSRPPMSPSPESQLKYPPSGAALPVPPVECRPSGNNLVEPPMPLDNLDLLWEVFDRDWGTSLMAYPPIFNDMNLFNFSHDEAPDLIGPLSTNHMHPTTPYTIDDSQHSHTEAESWSRYASRLPSVEPASVLDRPEENQDRNAECAHLPHSPQDHGPSVLKLSQEDYARALEAAQGFNRVLPTTIKLPSRHALNRHLEGFASGFQKHLPSIHVPSMKSAAPPLDLLLAMASIGAQYRFERKVSMTLYKAAKALVRRKTPEFDHDTTFTNFKDADKVPTTYAVSPPRALCPDVSIHKGYQDLDTAAPKRSSQFTTSAQITTIQSMLILIIQCTWNHKRMLHDGYIMATQVVALLQEGGFLCSNVHTPGSSWEEWIAIESQRRIVFIAFIMLNLASIVHHAPPKLMSRELFPIRLPSSEELWNAPNMEEWEALRSRSQCEDLTFGEAYSTLFSDDKFPPKGLGVSSFGNLILIHSIVQRIYLAWESSITFTGGVYERQESSLPPETVRTIETALRKWQVSWETSSESSLHPNCSKGTLGFNATALYRIAHIRLYLNLGPCRRLETRDPIAIAHAFIGAPKPPRTPQVYRALLQSLHSLSIPVRVGLEYVARTQTLDWSIIHCVCNLECVLLLSKWLECISFQPNSLCKEELRLLAILTSILDETELLRNDDDDDDDNSNSLNVEVSAAVTKIYDTAHLLHLSVIVIKLASLIFKGNHVLELLDVLRDSLERYKIILETGISTSHP